MSKLWEGSSDIFTDYEGTIVDASFENGQYGTQMKLTFDEIDGREDPVFEYYSIPDTWESQDGGDTITRVDGKDPEQHPLKKSNAWQRFVMAAAHCDGDVIETVGDDAPLRASAWIGTRWRMEAVEGKEYKDRDTGEKKKGKDKNYPVAFLGKDSQVSAPSSNGSANGKVDSLSVLTDIHNPVVEAQIQQWAKEMTHKEWFQKSYALLDENEVHPAQVPDLIAAMGARELYESLGGKG